MPDNPSKLQNIQLTGEPSDGLRPSVVKPDGSAGGAIPDGGIPSAAEQNIEGCTCDGKYPFCVVCRREALEMAKYVTRHL